MEKKQKNKSPEPNTLLNRLTKRLDMYYFQLREATAADNTEEAWKIVARCEELEWVRNELLKNDG